MFQRMREDIKAWASNPYIIGCIVALLTMPLSIKLTKYIAKAINQILKTLTEM